MFALVACSAAFSVTLLFIHLLYLGKNNQFGHTMSPKERVKFDRVARRAAMSRSRSVRSRSRDCKEGAPSIPPGGGRCRTSSERQTTSSANLLVNLISYVSVEFLNKTKLLLEIEVREGFKKPDIVIAIKSGLEFMKMVA